MRQLVSIEEALELIDEMTVPVRENEEVSIWEAGGRIAAKDYKAEYDQPPFDRSPLDGYALDHRTFEVENEEHTWKARVVGTSFAGDGESLLVRHGEAVRIMTGAPIPPGADCVVRQEDTDLGEEEVTIFGEKREAYDNVCFRGEDVRKGDMLIRQGERIASGETALLAAQGYGTVLVKQKAVVGVLSVGSELEQPGVNLQYGRIYDGNGPMIACRLSELGFCVQYAKTLDESGQIRETAERLLKTCDALVTSGGVSVGEKDFVPKALEDVGVVWAFQKVKMKPGSPICGGRWKEKLVFALSGNPFAAAATLELLAVYGLVGLQGRAKKREESFMAELAEDYPKTGFGKRFLRGYYLGNQVFLPEPQKQVSGSIASWKDSNCLAEVVFNGDGLKKGMKIKVIPFKI